jgi:hypothetical protein
VATPENESEKSDRDDDADEDILCAARKHFEIAEEAENEFRKNFLDDMRFLAGEQWPAAIKKERDQDGRPSLVINRLPQYVRQITNDQRQNRPAIKISPVDDQGDPETAKIYQGMIRHIEYNSSADTAYDTAFEGAVGGGRGFFRIITDYCDPTSFDQEIYIKRIRDHLSVYMDPFSAEPDGSDQSYCFVVEDLSKDSFEREYPKAELSGEGKWESLGSQAPGWVKENAVRVAEYFYKEYRDATIALLNNKQVIELKPGMALPEGIKVVSKRETQIPVIRWCKINGVEILERRDLPGTFIPIIPVYGNEIFVDGKRIIEGIVRHAKDPQRMYNYWASSETEMIALAPRAPFIGYAGQFEGFEADWKMANRRNLAYLQVNPKIINGQLPPLPQRVVFEPPVQAISQARFQSAEDIKATTGIYDAALGVKSNETSGRAIERRSVQSQTSNFHFVDNLRRSIRHAGRILLEWIPVVYDTARAVRIIGADGQEEIVRINDAFQQDQQTYQLGVGKYDATCDAGPSFATKRQEAANAMMDFVKTNPNAPIWDLIVKNMDWPGNQEIADRLRKMLPPGIAEDPKGKKPIPPEVQAQLQQQGQLIEQLTEHLNQRTQIIENKSIELESRERIEMAKIHAELEIEMARMGSKESIELLKHEIAQIGERLKMIGFDQPIDNGIDNENEVSAGGAPPAMAPQQNQPNPTGGTPPGTPME